MYHLPRICCTMYIIYEIRSSSCCPRLSGFKWSFFCRRLANIILSLINLFLGQLHATKCVLFKYNAFVLFNTFLETYLFGKKQFMNVEFMPFFKCRFYFACNNTFIGKVFPVPPVAFEKNYFPLLNQISLRSELNVYTRIYSFDTV